MVKVKKMARIEIRTNYEPIEKYLEREEVPEGIKEILRKTPEKYNAVCATILLHKDNAISIHQWSDFNEIKAEQLRKEIIKVSIHQWSDFNRKKLISKK